MKTPFILSCIIACSSSVIANDGPFLGANGMYGTYVSVKDSNSKAVNDTISTNKSYTYGQFLNEKSRIKNAKTNQRFIYEIDGFGMNDKRENRGKITIKKSADRKEVGSFYYKATKPDNKKIETTNAGKYEPETTTKKTAPKQAKRSLIDINNPHRVATFVDTATGKESTWMIFFPHALNVSEVYLNETLYKDEYLAFTGWTFFILYCPETGYIDLVAIDMDTYRQKAHAEHSEAEADCPPSLQ